MTTKIQDQLKKITGQTDFPFLSEGVAAAENISGFVLNEDALTALVEAAANVDTVNACLTEVQAQLTAANTARTAAEAALETANGTLYTNAASISELEARVQELEADPVIKQTSKKDDKKETAKAAFHLSEKNPMNQIADSLFGAPKEAVAE